jgi:hypothetical protein
VCACVCVSACSGENSECGTSRTEPNETSQSMMLCQMSNKYTVQVVRWNFSVADANHELTDLFRCTATLPKLGQITIGLALSDIRNATKTATD